MQKRREAALGSNNSHSSFLALGHKKEKKKKRDRTSDKSSRGRSKIFKPSLSQSLRAVLTTCLLKGFFIKTAM